MHVDGYSLRAFWNAQADISLPLPLSTRPLCYCPYVRHHATNDA